MNTQERQYLFKEKLQEGKSESTANGEILNLVNSQKIFKKLNTQINLLKRTIKKLEDRNIKLKEKSKEQKKQKLLERLGQGEKRIEDIKNGKHKVPTIHHINRILSFARVGDSYTKSELATELRIPSTMIDIALNFINRTNISKFELKEGRYKRMQ